MPADRGEIFTVLSTSNKPAQCNVLSRGILQHIDPGARVDHSHVVNLVAYGSQFISTLGVINVNFTCATLQFHVVDNDVKLLLGLRDSVKLGFVHLGPNVHSFQQGAPELSLRYDKRQHYSCSASEVPALHAYWHGKEDFVTVATAAGVAWILCTNFSTSLQIAWSACPSSSFCRKRHQHWGDFLPSQKCSFAKP